MLTALFFAIYFIAMLIIGRLFSRQIHTLKDFFLAGRQLQAWPVALALAASWFGAASTTGTINAFHDQGLSGIWQLFVPSILSFGFITFVMSKRIALQDFLSQPEAVEAHYGRSGRLLLACIILVATTVLIGSQLVAAGLVFEKTFGLSPLWSTLICATAVVSYTVWGGYFTVVVTDMAQILFVGVGFLILLFFTGGEVLRQPDGWTHFLNNHPPGFWQWHQNWLAQLPLVFTFVLAWSIAPEMWQRMSSTRNPDFAFRAGWQALLLVIVLYAVVIVIGLLSTQIIGPSNSVLVALALKLPNQSLSSLVLLGFVSAVTSAMDSSLNIGSLTLTRDVYQAFLRPNASVKECIRVSRITTVLMILPAIGLALFYQNIIQILWISADIYACCLFFPIMGLLYQAKPRYWSGNLAILFGGVSVLLSALFQYHALPNPFHWPAWPYSTLLGVGLSGIGYWIGSFLPNPPSAAPVLAAS